jgi:hypothetical protein
LPRIFYFRFTVEITCLRIIIQLVFRYGCRLDFQDFW